MTDTVTICITFDPARDKGVTVKMGGYVMELEETPELMKALGASFGNALLNGGGEGVPVGILSIK